MRSAHRDPQKVICGAPHLSLLLRSNPSHVGWGGGDGWLLSSSPRSSPIAFPARTFGGRKFLPSTVREPTRPSHTLRAEPGELIPIVLLGLYNRIIRLCLKKRKKKAALMFRLSETGSPAVGPMREAGWGQLLRYQLFKLFSYFVLFLGVLWWNAVYVPLLAVTRLCSTLFYIFFTSPINKATGWT